MSLGQCIDKYGPSELNTPVPSRDWNTSRITSPFSYSSKCVESTIFKIGQRHTNARSFRTDTTFMY